MISIVFPPYEILPHTTAYIYTANVQLGRSHAIITIRYVYKSTRINLCALTGVRCEQNELRFVTNLLLSFDWRSLGFSVLVFNHIYRWFSRRFMTCRRLHMSHPMNVSQFVAIATIFFS